MTSYTPLVVETSRVRSSFLASPEWKMAVGERAALEGVLSFAKPHLAIEIGSYKGGSLDCLSAHSRVVHSLDIERRGELTAERFPNVVFHTGDSHKLLTPLLAEFAEAGENVDFAFVDGEHSARGVRQDVGDLLASPCVGHTIILLHDALNERVRAALEELDLGAHEKVSFFDLDFVSGCLVREGRNANRLWGGLGLVVVGYGRLEAPFVKHPAHSTFAVFDSFRRNAAGAEHVPFREYALLEERIATLERSLDAMSGSLSWRLTAPLRRARMLLRR